MIHFSLLAFCVQSSFTGNIILVRCYLEPTRTHPLLVLNLTRVNLTFTTSGFLKTIVLTPYRKVSSSRSWLKLSGSLDEALSNAAESELYRGPSVLRWKFSVQGLSPLTEIRRNGPMSEGKKICSLSQYSPKGESL